MEVVEIHNYPELMDQCCDLINMEWPRNKTARLRTLEMSRDELPTCLVLVLSHEVLGHSKISPIPSIPSGCFIESVVIHPDYRGKGLGKFIMARTEDYVRSRGIQTAYLSTIDKQEFYRKLGYTECEPVQIYGGPVARKLNAELESLNKINKTNDSKEVRLPLASSVSTVTMSPPPPPLPPSPANTAAVVSRSTKVYMKKDL
ncbi:N-alpha-acetyltransferase 80-like isoform X1 [Periplaneta americana]|uniref:N-alpha-acetyltransferase 80-like isoform X1 n=2 Tax=Periplaneta americana TaxID=6978 RepID=UPI0037E75B05